MCTLPLHLVRTFLPAAGTLLFILSTPDLVVAQCRARIIRAFLTLNARLAPLRVGGPGAVRRQSDRALRRCAASRT